MSVKSGHRAVPLEDEELERHKDWHGYRSGLVRLHPGRWLYPSPYLRFADKIYNFKFRPSDVVILTYPKCGTTWLQEIISFMRNDQDVCLQEWKLRHPIRPFLDADMLLQDHLTSMSAPNPFMEAFESLCSGKDVNDGLMLQVTEAAPDPRTIKTHLPLSLLPPTLLDTCKVVCVARNPKDMLVSYFNHCRWTPLIGFQGSLEEFTEYFVDDDLLYGPYWLFLKEAWDNRHHTNLHFMHFEDMKKDIMEEMRKLNIFLTTQLSEEQLASIAKYTSFSEMKSRMEALGTTTEEKNHLKSFFRKGESGKWKNYLTPEMEAKVDKWIADNVTRIGAEFKFS